MVILAVFGAAYWYLFTPGFLVRGARKVDAAQAEAGGVLFNHKWTKNDPLAAGDGLVRDRGGRGACRFCGSDGRSDALLRGAKRRGNRVVTPPDCFVGRAAAASQ